MTNHERPSAELGSITPMQKLTGVIAMRQWRLAFACALVAAGVLTYVLLPGAQYREQRVTTEAGKRASQHAASSSKPPRQAQQAGSIAVASAPRHQEDLIKVDDPVWNVRTQAEADWMNRNMYPTTEQSERYTGGPSSAELPPDGIPRSPGDIVAAERIAALNGTDQDREKALDVLTNAAQSGSIYALQGLGRVYQQLDGQDVTSEAYFRAAVLRGDWGFSGLRDIRMGFRDNNDTDIRAYQILMNLNKGRRARGLPPLGVDLRPGLEDAIYEMEHR